MKKLLITISTALLISVAPAQAQKIEDWEYFPDIDPMTDQDNSHVMTMSDEGGALAFKCFGGKLAGLVVAGKYLGNDRAYMQYRFDGEPMRDGRFYIGPSGAMIEVTDKSFIESALSSAQVIIRLYGYRDRVAGVHTFSLRGSYDATGLLGCVADGSND